MQLGIHSTGERICRVKSGEQLRPLFRRFTNELRQPALDPPLLLLLPLQNLPADFCGPLLLLLGLPSLLRLTLAQHLGISGLGLLFSPATAAKGPHK
ncbi:hypothetical protein [Gluconacetobacter entanii]|uniref:hypothetical protein n=1 Tax=Gluconacetobacter entanii TaxID=108528 RepID=UPI00142E74B6|nr:hypothetical protein [Gluconacetobacter entanii]